MARLRLQKSANPDTGDLPPKEVLNPLNAVKEYTLRMYQPSGALSEFVDHYWVMRWDRRGKADFTCEVIPSPYINVTFMAGGTYITGITTGKYTYHLKDAGLIVGIKFLPGGFHAIWPNDASRLTDKVIPTSDILDHIDSSTNSAMLSMETDEQMVARAEAILLGMKPARDQKIKLVNDIIASVADDPRATIASTAARLGKSERWLQELFHNYVGVGLKWIILRSRLLKAAEIAISQESPNWAATASELGYADQSHFVNDFKRIIGKSPTQYAATSRSKN